MIRPILTIAFGAFASAALVFAGCSGENGSNDVSNFDDAGTLDSGTFDPGDPNAPPLITGDGGASQTPAQGTPEYLCYTAKIVKTCRNCCHDLHRAGRGVFTGALDRCVCQPSKCGGVCATTYCGSPQLAPTTECKKCVETQAVGVGDAGSARPDGGGGGGDAGAKDGGSAYPELGVQYCATYASDLCRADSECLAAEQCKIDSQCSSKPTSDPGPDR